MSELREAVRDRYAAAAVADGMHGAVVRAGEPA